MSNEARAPEAPVERPVPRLATLAALVTAGVSALGLALSLPSCGDGGAGPVGGGGTHGGTGTTSTGGGSAVPARAEACARINACDAEGGTPMGMQACLAYDLDAPWKWSAGAADVLRLSLLECKLAAADCATVRACSPEVGKHGAACADQAGATVCDGTVAVSCDYDGQPVTAVDCAAAGQSCAASPFGFEAGCVAETCDPTTFESRCDPSAPDVLLACKSWGNLIRVDCTTQYGFVAVHKVDGDHFYSIAGETCGFDQQRQANGCVGKGEACTSFSQQCNGAVLETCAGGKLGHRDCGALTPADQGCGFVQSGPFAGAAACGFVGGTCDLGISDESCQDGVVTYCSSAEPASLDCRALGYAGCAVANQGTRAIAYCTP
jgi:hypothetical protein